jgi:phosphoglycolate phosphatase-like HAD superfamily hydrolase
MPKNTVRVSARSLPEATASSAVDDGVFLILQAEIERLRATRKPLEDTANALYQSFEQTIRESGFEAARAWSDSVGMDSKIEEIEQIDRSSGHLIERMIEVGPKTPASIAAVASALKEEVLDHLWDKPKDDRDWDVELLTRFLDGLISMLPEANQGGHLIGVATVAPTALSQ